MHHVNCWVQCMNWESYCTSVKVAMLWVSNFHHGAQNFYSKSLGICLIMSSRMRQGSKVVLGKSFACLKCDSLHNYSKHRGCPKLRRYDCIVSRYVVTKACGSISHWRKFFILSNKVDELEEYIYASLCMYFAASFK